MMLDLSRVILQNRFRKRGLVAHTSANPVCFAVGHSGRRTILVEFSALAIRLLNPAGEFHDARPRPTPVCDGLRRFAL